MVMSKIMNLSFANLNNNCYYYLLRNVTALGVKFSLLCNWVLVSHLRWFLRSLFLICVRDLIWVLSVEGSLSKIMNLPFTNLNNDYYHLLRNVTALGVSSVYFVTEYWFHAFDGFYEAYS